MGTHSESLALAITLSKKVSIVVRCVPTLMVERKMDTRQLSAVYREARCAILFRHRTGRIVLSVVEQLHRMLSHSCGNLIAYIRDCVITISEKVGI